MNHSMMNHTGMHHSMMNHSDVHHAGMNHTGMDHSGMDHTGMDHSGMDHTGMDHSGMDHSGMDHGMHSGMGHMMKMYFHQGDSEYILFEDLLTDSTGTMVAACLTIFVVAVLYEGLKYMREHLLQRSLMAEGSGSYAIKEGNSREHIVMQTQQSNSISNRMLSSSHFLQTLLHVVQVFISYCLMLVFMTYNIWLCLAVVLGAGVGYFLFGWRRAVVVDNNEHCH